MRRWARAGLEIFIPPRRSVSATSSSCARSGDVAQDRSVRAAVRSPAAVRVDHLRPIIHGGRRVDSSA
jgi:hypothetical protein